MSRLLLACLFALLLVVNQSKAGSDYCSPLLDRITSTNPQKLLEKDISNNFLHVGNCSESSDEYLCAFPQIEPDTTISLPTTTKPCIAKTTKQFWYWTYIDKSKDIYSESPSSLIEPNCKRANIEFGPAFIGRARVFNKCNPTNTKKIRERARLLTKDATNDNICSSFRSLYVLNDHLVIERIACECGTDACGYLYYEIGKE